MNYYWKNTKVGIYNLKSLREHIGLNIPQFNKLLELEVERYKNMICKRYGKEYYTSKLVECPHIAKTGGIPVFKPHPLKTNSYIYNEESGVFLEKTWSKSNKYNLNLELPFDFVFKG